MLTDDAWIRGEIECCDLYPSDHSRRMKSALLELLAWRNLDRCEIAAANAELAGRDSHDAWAAVLKARTELDEGTR